MFTINLETLNANNPPVDDQQKLTLINKLFNNLTKKMIKFSSCQVVPTRDTTFLKA